MCGGRLGYRFFCVCFGLVFCGGLRVLVWLCLGVSFFVCGGLVRAWKGFSFVWFVLFCGVVVAVPLTERVSFRVVLRRRGRFQVPRVLRWRFKLEASQALSCRVRPVDSIAVEEEFFVHMRSDGRITVPKLTRALLARHLVEGSSLVGAFLRIDLSPL